MHDQDSTNDIVLEVLARQQRGPKPPPKRLVEQVTTLSNPLVESSDELLAGYVVREEDHRVVEALARNDVRVVTVSGAPGSGKSALAKRYAMLHKSDYDELFIVNAYDERDLEQHKSNIGDVDRRALIIVDDLGTGPSYERITENVKNLVETLRNSKLLITQRDSSSIAAQVSIELGGLNDSQLREYIAKHLDFTNVTWTDIQHINGFARSNPLLLRQLGQLLHDVGSVDSLLASLQPFVVSPLVGPSGLPLRKHSVGEHRIVAEVTTVNDALLRVLTDNPNALYDLPSRKFEEVIAEILHRLGYQITLTPATRDGGKDIYAAKKNELGSFLYLVECKRYAPHRHVGVDVIRQLYGVVETENATAGIVATTSYFTKEAKDHQSRLKHKISLKDYVSISEWLRQVGFTPKNVA